MEKLQLTEPVSTGELLARALQSLDEHLPDDWSTSLAAADNDPYIDRRRQPDALLEVEAPDRRMARFAVVAKLVLAGREVDSTLEILRQYGETHGTSSLVVARFLSSTVRDRLAEHDVSYVDACGNLRVASSVPAMALFRPGLDRDPWRRAHTRQQLKGEPAARVVKTLFEEEIPIKIADLIELSGASAGATYRALDMLVEEGLVEKGARGWIASVDRIGMLKRWAEDWAAAASRYAFKVNTMLGVDGTLRQLKREPRDTYVLGGGHAAALVTDVGADSTTIVHTGDSIHPLFIPAGQFKRDIDGPDLIVVRRDLASAQVGAITSGKLRLASPAQAYADLILSGDRAAAETLLESL